MYLPCSQTLAALIIRTPVVLVTVIVVICWTLAWSHMVGTVAKEDKLASC